MALVNCSRLQESKPSMVKSSWSESLSRMRMTVFSPKIVGKVETRKSISRWLKRSLMRPSWQPTLRDVEARHDLHARGERGLQALGRRHDLVEHAVHPEADAEHLLVGLEMDIGSASPDGINEDHVDEAYHRCLIRRLLQLEDVDLGGELLLAFHQLDVGGGA